MSITKDIPQTLIRILKGKSHDFFPSNNSLCDKVYESKATLNFLVVDTSYFSPCSTVRAAEYECVCFCSLGA